MSVRVQMNGLEELRRQIHNLPEELATEAGDIVLEFAEMAKRDVQTAYPTGRTGNLKRRVSIQRNRSKVASSAIVKATAPHAWIFEKGTVTRRTDKGWNRGRMPEASQAEKAIPKFVRIRARMVQALIALVERAGFEVQQ